MTNLHQRAAAGAFVVALGYAAVAGLWILLSDRAAGLLFTNHETLVWASMVKGWFFVAVTAVLLYALVHRLARRLIDLQRRELVLEHERRQPPPMLVAIADASTDAIFAKDEQGRYLLLNRAAAAFIGKPAADLLGRDDHAFFPPEQAAHIMGIDRRVRESGQAETTEEVLHTADGERTFLATKGPLRGADGQVFGTYGISRDITDRKQAEGSLQAVADDLSATLQAIPDLMFELDGRGCYVKAKALNESLLAAPADRLFGRSVGDVLPPDAAATVMQALGAASQAGVDFGRTFSLPLPGGDRQFELSVARKPVLAGRAEHFIVLSRDITARHAAQVELRQRNQELERFNRAATERELRMVALKREVNELARAAGRPMPYDLAFADAGAAPAAP